MRTAIRASRSDHSEDPTVEVVQQGLADEAPFGRVGLPGKRGRPGEGFFLDLVEVHSVLLPAFGVFGALGRLQMWVWAPCRAIGSRGSNGVYRLMVQSHLPQMSPSKVSEMAGAVAAPYAGTGSESLPVEGRSGAAGKAAPMSSLYLFLGFPGGVVVSENNAPGI